MGWTFQSLIDAKMAVTAFCNVAACGHTKTLNLENLRQRDQSSRAGHLQSALQVQPNL
ncbi:hypothetical protein [Mesorhizobium australicum]|uniref:hypothetical protein n=1 Tax=Mesorhizobium australicum TaxID=536018 RepID=UPI00333C7AD4